MCNDHENLVYEMHEILIYDTLRNTASMHTLFLPLFPIFKSPSFQILHVNGSMRRRVFT